MINTFSVLTTKANELLEEIHNEKKRMPRKARKRYTQPKQMAKLSFIEKGKFEKLFGMDSGYVLDFSNNTFQKFIVDSLKINKGDGS